MLILNQMGSKLAMRSGNGFKCCYALRKMGSGNESQLDNIRWEKCWVREVSLVVYACGERNPNSYTL